MLTVLYLITMLFPAIIIYSFVLMAVVGDLNDKDKKDDSEE